MLLEELANRLSFVRGEIVEDDVNLLPEGTAMSSSSIRKHAGTGAASDQPAVPEPSFAERARTLVYMARIGNLSTLSPCPSPRVWRAVWGQIGYGRPSGHKIALRAVCPSRTRMFTGPKQVSFLKMARWQQP
jgi:hypothetical protein